VSDLTEISLRKVGSVCLTEHSNKRLGRGELPKTLPKNVTFFTRSVPALGFIFQLNHRELYNSVHKSIIYMMLFLLCKVYICSVQVFKTGEIPFCANLLVLLFMMSPRQNLTEI